MLFEALSYSFFQRALLAALLSSIACGMVGSLVVVKRMSSISGGLSHAAFGGVGLGYALGFSPMLGAVLFGVFSGLLIGVAYLKFREGLDTLVATVWSVGMALGVLLVALTPGYAPDLNSFLFGSILFVEQGYLLSVLLLDTAVLVTVGALFKHIRAVAFDEEFCAVSGVPQQVIFLLIMLLTSLTVVTLMRVVGAILLISLLTIPAVVARSWSNSLRRMMVFAIGISAFCSIGGLFLSYGLSSRFSVHAPPGPLIVLLCAGVYLVGSTIKFSRMAILGSLLLVVPYAHGEAPATPYRIGVILPLSGNVASLGNYVKRGIALPCQRLLSG